MKATVGRERFRFRRKPRWTNQRRLSLGSNRPRPLYRAETKFNSGTGWPSFWQPIRKQAVHERSTFSAIFGVEVSCARCGSHLGHVFNDGPPPTELRYCMNAVALTYREALAGSVTPALPRADQGRP